jgi:hypothetical protein
MQVSIKFKFMLIDALHNPLLKSLLLEQTVTYGAFTLDVKSVLNENLGGILGGTQC